jgi:hypothetical protein
MLNMNRYVNLLGERFRNGVFIDFGGINLNRFTNGEHRLDITGPSIISPGTGHWPFPLFRFGYVTGDLSQWQVSLLGMTVGTCYVHDLDEDGNVQGPDKKKVYRVLSCLNHQHKHLEEII